MKKKLLLLALGLVVSPISSEIELSASETQVNYVEERVYAPTHPTREEVEAASATDLVIIPDPNLEELISSTLSVPIGEITVGDMERFLNQNFLNQRKLRI